MLLLLYFSGSCIPTNESLFILLALYLQTVQDTYIVCDMRSMFSRGIKPSFHKVVSCRYLSFGVLGVILKDRKRPSETENDSVAGSL
jgi:hypothetical protein